MCLALSKDQARIILDYADAILRSRPALQRLIAGRDADGIRLTNGVEIACFANSFRLVRGPTVVCAIMDEVAVWWSEELAANPDKEIVRAIRPSMITQPGALMIGLSSPYAKKGLLFEKHRDHFGRDNSNVLVWQADTATMNRQIDPDLIDQAYDEDPASAAAEFGAQFRDDLQSFIAREAVEACVELGCRERAPERRIEYRAFVDPAGGGKSGNDAMTLAIAHLDGDLVVVDCVREYHPPFTPTEVVAEIAETLKPYRCTVVVGDQFAGEWCRAPFRKFGIRYKEADRSKSDIYRDCLPILNSRKVSLLDNRAAVNQICALERRTARGGRDSIDHPRNAHDDLANAVCGVIVMTAQKSFAKSYETLAHRVRVRCRCAADRSRVSRASRDRKLAPIL